jgi:hypothetical protein
MVLLLGILVLSAAHFFQAAEGQLPQSLRSAKSTLWLFNIAMANCPFIDGLPIKNDDFPWLC